jgi:hypothetical protein
MSDWFKGMDPASAWWIKAVFYALFASAGGVLGHLVRSLDKNQPINWGRAVIEGCAAGFVGVLVLFMCQAMNLSETWTGVIVGVCGWLGASTTIQLLEKVVHKRLGIGEGPQT